MAKMVHLLKAEAADQQYVVGIIKCHCKCLVTFNACTIVIIISNHSNIDRCVVYIYAYVYYVLDSGHGICEKRSYECIQLCNLE